MYSTPGEFVSTPQEAKAIATVIAENVFNRGRFILTVLYA
jgi:hypothetical protein